MMEVNRGVSGSSQAVRRVGELLDIVFPRPRGFAIRLWTGEELPVDGQAAFTLVIRSPGSLRRMFRVPLELSLGEAYLRKDFEIEGDLAAAFELPHLARDTAASAAGAAALLAAWLRLPRTGEAAAAIHRGPALLEGREHSRGRDRNAIRYHYDVGNEFYRLFLDDRMIYSCAYFRDDEDDLEAAQEAKLDLICRKLRLRPEQRLLDVGCGWGGLLIHAASRFGVRGVGVTLSVEQNRLAMERVSKAGLTGRVTIEQRDYRDLRNTGFDRIVSVGMFEHVGRSRFPEYFATIRRLLRPGGLFLNHAIANRPTPSRQRRGAHLVSAIERWIVGNETFRKRYIFPDGELAALSVANYQAELAGFEVRDVENLREHYVLTLRHWLRRLRENRLHAIRLAGEPVFRLWEMYLAGSIHHFETGRITINQTLMAKDDRGRSEVPTTREDLYAQDIDVLAVKK